MKLPRRKFLHLAAGAAALPAVSRIARAQAYPTRPVRLIDGYPPGGSADITARLIGEWLSERLGQLFTIDNRPGGGGNIATEAVVSAPPDGHTLLLVGTSHTVNATLYDKLNFNFVRDIAPVGGIIRQPQVMLVNPSVPAKTVHEFVADAKANPGKITMASGGNGSSSHLSGELFKMTAGDQSGPRAVSRRGTGAHGPAWRTGAGLFRPRARDNRAHQVRQTSRARCDDIDALGGIAGRSDRGRICAGLRGDRILWRCCASEHAHRDRRQAQQGNKCRLCRSQDEGANCRPGSIVLPGSPADFAKFIADETEKWGKVIRAANIKAG